MSVAAGMRVVDFNFVDSEVVTEKMAAFGIAGGGGHQAPFYDPSSTGRAYRRIESGRVNMIITRNNI